MFIMCFTSRCVPLQQWSYGLPLELEIWFKWLYVALFLCRRWEVSLSEERKLCYFIVQRDPVYVFHLDYKTDEESPQSRIDLDPEQYLNWCVYLVKHLATTQSIIVTAEDTTETSAHLSRWSRCRPSQIRVRNMTTSGSQVRFSLANFFFLKQYFIVPILCAAKF